MKTKHYFIPDNITKEQIKDTGMAMVLICLLIGFLGNKQSFFSIAIFLLIINMTWFNAYKPITKIWIGISKLLGAVISKILLTLIFFIVVTPVGLIRRAIGFDTLQLRKWKKNNLSVFKIRNHTFESKDIETPY